MARAAKSAVVLCMDVGFSMSNVVPGEESPLELAKKVMTLFVQRQVFAESKDEIAVVLFGTDGTDNALGSGNQYQNITVHRHLMMPDFDLLEDIETAITAGSQQADFLDALIVCMDLLQKETLGKKFERLHIAVFTDLSSPFSMDQLDIIIANLKRTGISLQFFLPFPLDSDDDGGGSGEQNGGGGDWSYKDEYKGCLPGKGLTVQQRDGIQMVKKIMMTLDEEGELDEVYTFRESLTRLSIFKKIERRPMPWPCLLTIGTNLSIKIVGYKAVTEENVKKTWAIVDAKTQRKEDVQKETVYCLNDDNETEVSKDDTIQGYRYGSDIIPFSKVDQEQMKYKHDGKCFSVLGFTNSSQIQRSHFMGKQILKIFPPKDDEAAAVALSALIQALDETDMVAIVRYAYDRRSNPQIGAAFPCIKDKYECLVYVQLPFMEDLRQYLFSSLKNNKKVIPSEEQLSAVDSLIDSMSLVHDDGETVEDYFKPTKIPNPRFQRLFQCLQHRAFHPGDPLPAIEQQILDMLDKPQEVTARCQASLEKIKNHFPLQEVSKKKDQKTAEDIFQNKNEGEPNAKNAKIEEEDSEFSIAHLAEGNITSVGSVSPAEDYRILVRQKNANIKEVSQQLIDRIYECLETKGLPYYMKSLKCISAFRQEAIKLSNVQQFNSFLKTLKEKVEDRSLTEFWDIIVQDGLSLITSDEAAGSSVTSEEAKRFLAPEQKPAETTSVADEHGDVDDLLDMM
ncbi:X-ray repair cross-complementing protein 5 [Microcaecilia unicolor]|uniref:X-ray repair cross-complementing protein 5 n=1 Tax=Microcaecilia unicolor TaxID=1415580 RepID=A0A6P7YLW6_9AMPH|nr:X-ray repair cross-complementing protein 5 [Microcaecilia unicolor]